MKLGVELPCLRKGDLGRIEQAVAIQTPAVARCRLKAGDDQRDCRRCTSVRQRRKPMVFREGIESPSNTRGDPFRKCVGDNSVNQLDNYRRKLLLLLGVDRP